jgi:KaiC/GvpD/RAD55 family RecA-like ATPase
MGDVVVEKKSIFSRIFGSKHRESEKDSSEKIVDNKKNTQLGKEGLKQVVGQEVKVKMMDSPSSKDIEREELRIAKKIALEFVGSKEKVTKKIENGSGIKNTDKGLSEAERIIKASKTSPNSTGYFKTGIKGFDSLMNEGIPESTSVLIEGGPGSGKTIFCLHVAMEFCRQGKKVLYMSFEEPEDRLVSHMKKFGFEVEKYLRNGTLVLKRFNALDIARSVEALLSEAKKELLIEVQPILIPKEIDPDLVLVDSLTSIASAFSGEESRFRIYMEQLFRYLEQHNMTSLLIREVSNPGHVGAGSAGDGSEATSFLSDGIIVFYNVVFNSGDRTRAVEILKLRGQSFDRRIVKAEIINGKGLVIYPKETLKGKNYKLT